MIQKNTKVYPIDKSGVSICNTFHLYKGGRRTSTSVGNFTKISVRKASVDSKLKKKKKSIFLNTSSFYPSTKFDGSKVFMINNCGVLIKRKLVLRSKEIVKPGYKAINRRKLQYKFPGIL